MKKYLTIMAGIMFLSTAVLAQTVNRTVKTPSFFMPENALKNKNDAEKLSLMKTTLYKHGSAASITSNSNTISPLPDIRYAPASIETILEKQKNLPKNDLNKYKKSIVRSYKLSLDDLQKILQWEYENINKETLRMEAVLRHLKTAAPSYRFANFKIEKQISQDMVKNRKRYKKLQQKFKEIIESEPKNQSIYIIEARNDLFWLHYGLSEQWQNNWRGYTSGYHFKDITYISIFNHEYSHLFSYYRQHLNMLKNRRIPAPDMTAHFYINQDTVNTYQRLFDEYINDLNRIGKGLDVNNPLLLRQLDDMQNKKISI